MSLIRSEMMESLRAMEDAEGATAASAQGRSGVFPRVCGAEQEVQGRIGDERQVAPHACRISDPFEQCGHAEANGLDLCVRPSVSLSLFRFHVDGRRK